MQSITVNAWKYHAAGAGLTQELAFALAHGHEYLVKLLEAGIAIDAAAACIRFEFASGSHYFPEIAKLRAFRKLWATVVKAYGPKEESCMAAHIHCRTSSWSMTKFDEHTNILRATTQAMSSVLGGCQSLSVEAFNALNKPDDSLGQRIALQLQLVLKEEAYLNRVNDPAAGSWYLEKLTQELSTKAWKLFQETEKKGGLVTALKANWIQDQIETMAAKKQHLIAEGKWTVLGVNKHPNAKDDTEAEPIKAPAPVGIIRPLFLHRGSATAELELSNSKA